MHLLARPHDLHAITPPMSIPAGGSRASWKPGSGRMPATLPRTLQHVTIMAGRVPPERPNGPAPGLPASGLITGRLNTCRQLDLARATRGGACKPMSKRGLRQKRLFSEPDRPSVRPSACYSRYALVAFRGLCRQATEVDRVLSAVLFTGIMGPPGGDVGQVVRSRAV